MNPALPPCPLPPCPAPAAAAPGADVASKPPPRRRIRRKPQLPIPALVNRLGGQAVLAARLGLTISAVGSWHLEGVPRKHWPALARIAAEHPATRDVTEDVLAQPQYGSPCSSRRQRTLNDGVPAGQDATPLPSRGDAA